MEECTMHHHTERTSQEKQALLVRLNKIEGQIRGIMKMVDEDRYCPHILTQVSAVQSALHSFNKLLLANHIKGCVMHDVQHGDTKAIDELVEVLQKVMK